MKISICQLKVVPGNPKENCKQIIKNINDAKKQNVEIIVFPEMSVGGYFLSDLWLDDSFCLDLESYNEDIINETDNITVIFGNVYVDKSGSVNHDGRTRKYNAVYVYKDRKPVNRIKPCSALPAGVQPKTLLPNYRYFDDKRYFYGLNDIAHELNIPLKDLSIPFDVNGQNIAVQLCEDLWIADYIENKKPINVSQYAIDNGAEVIFNLSASPWTIGKHSARDRRISFLNNESFVPFIYTNCVGVQNNGKNIIAFDGGSTVYNSNGETVITLNSNYKPENRIFNLEDIDSLDTIERKVKSDIEQKYLTIVHSIKEFFTMMGNPKIVIGLSGGVDSCVVAALAVKAIGRENVMGINMPTKYNSEETKRAALRVAQRLGIDYEVIPIGSLVKLNTAIVASTDLDRKNQPLSQLNEENIQAKLRGTTVLSNVAAKYGAVFTNNGNKLETAVGYATLYGDVGGAIAPIGDLTKSEVFEIGRYLNDIVYKDEVISRKLFPDDEFRFSEGDIQPSAELKNNQIDPMKFGYHCALVNAYTNFKKASAENILEWYIDGTICDKLNISEKLFERWGLNNKDVFVKDLIWFDRQYHLSVFKRIQSPPIILTSRTSFGYDLRESQVTYIQSRKFTKLLEQVKDEKIINN